MKQNTSYLVPGSATSAKLNGVAKAVGDLRRMSFSDKRPMPHYATCPKFKYCYLNYQTRSWIVKFYVSKRQRVVGVFRNNTECAAERAVRWADMFTLFFWRHRDPDREPLDADFNFSVAEARKDLETCEFGRRMLEEIEKLWLADGTVVPAVPSGNYSPFYLSELAQTAGASWKAHSRQVAALTKAFRENPATAAHRDMVLAATAVYEKYLDSFVARVMSLAAPPAAESKVDPEVFAPTVQAVD